MDLRHPITSVVPSLDAYVLEALSRSSSPASLTKVQQRAGRGSLSGVRRVLERMVEQGLVVRDATGYALNRNHLAADAVTSLTSLHAAFEERLRAWIHDRDELIEAVGLFGSMARREGGTDSDIDLLVIAEEGDLVALREDLTAAVRSWTGNDVQVVVLTRSAVRELHEQRAALLDSWGRDLVMVTGPRDAVLG